MGDGQILNGKNTYLGKNIQKGEDHRHQCIRIRHSQNGVTHRVLSIIFIDIFIFKTILLRIWDSFWGKKG